MSLTGCTFKPSPRRIMRGDFELAMGLRPTHRMKVVSGRLIPNDFRRNVVA